MNKNLSNLLVIDGGAVKTDDEGIVNGLGIVFGSENEPDQSKERDFFTKDTFVRKSKSFTVPLYYNHGFGPINTEIGEATLTKSDTGWEASAKLDLSDDFGKKVYEAVKENPHGFSTGALQHLVKRETKGNNTNFLRQWVVGELSLTERPAERKAVVQTVKSVDGEIVTSDAWTDTIDNVIFYDKDKKELWNLTDGAEKLEGLKPNSVEIKFAYGSTTYSFYAYDEDEQRGVDIYAVEMSTPEQVLSKIQNLLAGVKTSEETPKDKESDDLESKITEIVKKLIKEELQTQEIVPTQDEPETKNSEASAEDELADLRDKLSNSEDALTKANEQIARLEILAGAKQTINNKGK